jgi:hypothetical protein
LGSHGPLETGVGMKVSLVRSWVKNGWFFVMACDHGGFGCVKSRAGVLLIPHGEEARSAVSNHAGPTVATSFETRCALLRMRVWQW